MIVRLLRGAWLGDRPGAAGDVLTLPEGLGATLVWSGKAVEVDAMPASGPAPLEHRDPAVAHRDPPKARRR